MEHIKLKETIFKRLLEAHINKAVNERGIKSVIYQSSPVPGVYLDNSFFSYDKLKITLKPQIDQALIKTLELYR
jgi:hypothetical protein